LLVWNIKRLLESAHERRRTMRLVQFMDRDQARRVAMVSEDGKALRVLRHTQRVHELALEAGRRKLALSALVQDRLGMDSIS
jgi:hypothetical protein